MAKFTERLRNMGIWALSRGKRERDVIDAADKLQMSIRTTAKCRFNASVRLQRQSQWSFFTATFLSLGLIFIPLMQAAEVCLAFNSKLLNAVQIFLAVAVLVYSLVINAAKYELRAEQLTECGNRLKELSRELDLIRESNSNAVPKSDLERFQRTYSDVVTDVENHRRNDYRFASLEMTNDYFLTGLPRLWLLVQANLVRLASFVLPTTLMALEVLVISDMLHVSSIIRPLFDENTSCS